VVSKVEWADVVDAEHGILKTLMLRLTKALQRLSQRGDTLIEVTFALAILGFVLLGSTSLASDAFRIGQTAGERTSMAEGAQQQLEALRSFRDNNAWATFRNSASCSQSGGFCGIDQVLSAGMAKPCTCPAGATPCPFTNSPQDCFSMSLANTGGGTTQWVPKPGANLAIQSSVPTGEIEIASPSENVIPSPSPCGYDFVLYYFFETPGSSSLASNQIETRLVNLNYSKPALGGVVCP
jgi:type II secretory pathway pseudopilin PulG